MRTTRHQTRCRVGRMFPSNGALTQVGLTLACVLVVLAMTSLGHAQATATVEGLVADSTGAVLPRAQVVATSLATGLARSTDANSDGYYRMASLPVGAYDITVTLTGFKKTLLSGVVFTVGQVARVDVTMQVGDVQQEVTVEGTAPLVDTSTTAVGGVVENKQITAMPLNGRHFLQLGLLIPGVSEPQTGSTQS